jgi:hypothetical protein
VNLLLQSERDGNILLETRAGIKPVADFILELEKILGPECWRFGARPKGKVQEGSIA